MRKMSHHKSSSYWPYPAMSKRQYRRWRGKLKAAELSGDVKEWIRVDDLWFYAVKDSYGRNSDAFGKVAR